MKFIYSILLSFFAIFSSFSAEYEVSVLGLETTSDESWHVKELNDEGQIVGTHFDGIKNEIFIFDPQKGITLIENEDYLYPWKINNAGEVVGMVNLKTGVQKPFIWNKAAGTRYLELDSQSVYSLIDMNDLGQILMVQSWNNQGVWSEKPFIWYYGVVTDLGPGSEFAKKFETLGYDIMYINLNAINNKGEMIGSFSVGKFNEKKNKFVVVGTHYFFWDGDLIVLPFTNDRFSLSHRALKLNNSGTVMASFVSYGMGNQNTFTYLWNAKEGLKVIQNFEGRDLNDSNTVLGVMVDPKEVNRYKNVPAIWKRNSIKALHELLGVENLTMMAPKYSETYDAERIELSYQINNKGEIPCTATIWGDQYKAVLKAKTRP